VARAFVRGELDRVLDALEREVREQTQALRDRTLALDAWQRAMIAAIQTAHGAAAAAAVGGWDRMSAADWMQVEAEVARQVRYLHRFGMQMATSAIPMDGRVLPRAVQYINGARVTFAAWAHQQAVGAGNQWERSVRNARDSCPGCVAAARAGWQPIGTLPPVGRRDCRNHCRCRMEYRIDVP
jgi:hypothetical protein